MAGPVKRSTSEARLKGGSTLTIVSRQGSQGCLLGHLAVPFPSRSNIQFVCIEAATCLRHACMSQCAAKAIEKGLQQMAMTDRTLLSLFLRVQLYSQASCVQAEDKAFRPAPAMTMTEHPSRPVAAGD